MKNIGLGLHLYHTPNGRFPSAIQIGDYQTNDSSENWYQNKYQYQRPIGGLLFVDKARKIRYPIEGAHWSWAARIAPFIGDQAVLQNVTLQPAEAKTNWPWNQINPDGTSVLSKASRNFRCPSDSLDPFVSVPFGDETSNRTEFALTSFLGVAGLHQFKEKAGPTKRPGQNGILFVNSSLRLIDITDGLSYTLAAGERPPGTNRRYGLLWAAKGEFPFFGTADIVLGVQERTSLDSIPDFYRPGMLNDPQDQHRYHFWSFHKGGANWLFADGSVRYLSYAISTNERDSIPLIEKLKDVFPEPIPEFRNNGQDNKPLLDHLSSISDSEMVFPNHD